MVTSKPKRISVASGLVHIVISLDLSLLAHVHSHNRGNHCTPLMMFMRLSQTALGLEHPDPAQRTHSNQNQRAEYHDQRNCIEP